MSHDIFISYASDDKRAASRIRRMLEASGVTCWIDTHDIPGASVWPAEIVEAIRGCRALLLILPTLPNRSENVAREVELAAHARKKLLMIRLNNVATSPDIELFVSNLERLDAFPAPLGFYGPKIIRSVWRLLQREKPPDPMVRLWWRTNRRTMITSATTAAALLITWASWPCRRDYQIRLALLDPDGHLVDATPSVSPPAEARKLPAGWEVRLPRAARPGDGKLVVSASTADGALAGTSELPLGNSCAVTTASIHLRRNTATVRGRVIDAAGVGVGGARVSLEQYEQEAIVTGSGGEFELNAHAPAGTYLMLHVEKSGFPSVDQSHFAGPDPATIVLNK
jgi:hypothetical protein